MCKVRCWRGLFGNKIPISGVEERARLPLPRPLAGLAMLSRLHLSPSTFKTAPPYGSSVSSQLLLSGCTYEA